MQIDMSSSAKKFYIVLEDPKRFEFDRDYILAASTLVDNVEVFMTPECHNEILKNSLYAKQLKGLKEYDVNLIVTPTLPASPVQTIPNPALINFDELVDFIVNLNGENHGPG